MQLFDALRRTGDDFTCSPSQRVARAYKPAAGEPGAGEKSRPPNLDVRGHSRLGTCETAEFTPWEMEHDYSRESGSAPEIH